MVNFLQSFKFNRLLISCVLTSFTISTFNHSLCAATSGGGINLNDVGFAIRIEKLIKKINKYRERGDSKKLLETMFDLKMEIEGYTGQAINLDKQLDHIESEIKNNGGKLQKNEMKKIRKIIKKGEKRSNHKSEYMAHCLELGVPYNSEEEEMLFNNQFIAKQDKDNKEEISVPLRVTIGVTVALCGLFLFFVPIPVCKVWGPELMKAGVILAVEGTINRVEDNNKKEIKIA